MHNATRIVHWQCDTRAPQIRPQDRVASSDANAHHTNHRRRLHRADDASEKRESILHGNPHTLALEDEGPRTADSAWQGPVYWRGFTEHVTEHVTEHERVRHTKFAEPAPPRGGQYGGDGDECDAASRWNGKGDEGEQGDSACRRDVEGDCTCRAGVGGDTCRGGVEGGCTCRADAEGECTCRGVEGGFTCRAEVRVPAEVEGDCTSGGGVECDGTCRGGVEGDCTSSGRGEIYR